MIHSTVPASGVRHLLPKTGLWRWSRALSALAAAVPARRAQPESLEHGEDVHPDHSHDHVLARIWAFIAERSNFGGSLEDLQSEWKAGRLHLSENLVLDVLRRFGKDWRSALRFFQGASHPNSSYKHGACAYTEMVDLLGRAREFNRMWAMVHEMWHAGLFGVEAFTKVVRRLVGAGRWEEAIGVFSRLEDMGLWKDSTTLTVLLDVLCKKKKVEVAYELFLYNLPTIAPEVHMLNILVHGWCIVGRIDMAEEMLAKMKLWGFSPSVITYTAILQAHCRNLDFSKVFELMNKMADEGCAPNVVAYTSVMISLAESGNINAVCKIVERMKLEGCKPDLFFYNSLISILGKAGRLREASYVFEVEMLENGVAPDLSTYNTFISVLCQHKEKDMALSVLRRVESSAWNPDIHTFNPLLKLCIRSGYHADMRSLLNNMENKHQIILDPTTYALLVRGLCRVGAYEAAFFTFEGMTKRGVLPMNVDMYDFLVLEAERNGLSDYVNWLNTFKKRFKEFYQKNKR